MHTQAHPLPACRHALRDAAHPLSRDRRLHFHVAYYVCLHRAVAALSTTLSTAALDKHPQSKERGITLDLGFSAFTVSTESGCMSLCWARLASERLEMGDASTWPCWQLARLERCQALTVERSDCEAHSLEPPPLTHPPTPLVVVTPTHKQTNKPTITVLHTRSLCLSPCSSWAMTPCSSHSLTAPVTPHSSAPSLGEHKSSTQ